MIDSLSCFRYRYCWSVLTGGFCRGSDLRFRVGAIEMTPYAEVDGYAHGHHCCGAQYQDNEQNLDHHRYSGYQIDLGRL